MIIDAVAARRHGLSGSFGAVPAARTSASPAIRRGTSRVRDGLVAAAAAAAIVGCAWFFANAAAAAPPSRDSQKLRAMQIIATRAVATVSGMTVTSAIDGVIGKTFAPRLGAGLTSEPPNGSWRAWADMRGIGIESDANAAGRQFNVTAGVGRMIGSDVLIGAFAGYENSRFTVDALSGRMEENGFTLGGYAAWRFLENWRIDGKLGRSHVWYDDRAGAAEGSFDGARWLAGGGLTGIYPAGGVLVEPSSRVYAVWEGDDAYTDSRGAPQAPRDFSDGRVATGAKVAYPMALADVGVMPYVGAYGDYRFSNRTKLPTGAAFPGLEDGWSARLSSGLRVTLPNGAVATLGGDYGGIGADSQRWAVSATLLWLF